MRAYWVILVGMLGLGVAGCATKDYTQEQAAAVTKAEDAKVGEVQRQVEATQMDVTNLKESDAAQNEQIAKLADTAKEALNRANQAAIMVPPPEVPAFPWPPPQPTSFMEIRRDLLLTATGPTTWGDVARRLRAAADHAGYQGYTWYSVPNGFAFVLHVEQFDESGRAKNPRWITEPSCGGFSLSCIVQALFTASPGSYRVLAFVVATGPVKIDLGTAMTIEWARQVWKAGSTTFPPRFEGNEFSDDHSCLVLVYEFKQTGQQQKAAFRGESTLTALNHLTGSGLLAALGGA
ncbi:MAG TPA: hypothetical protein VMT19_03800 [Thermoanaerobaculaceae bacterium]|nr:hypothetical protein [Thermoanaerobaculaceae bacterium]